MKPKISFCIPTYNRADLLRVTVESIIRQCPENTEIVISDNASVDHTEEVIRDMQKRSPCIRYHRNPENVGPSRNYLLAVELAEGEYCWLMGSDDILAEGAVARMLREIEAGHDIYLCNRMDCDYNMKPIGINCFLRNEIPDRVFDLGTDKGLLEYLSKARHLGALFSYLSSIVFMRERWSAVRMEDPFLDTAYSHTFMLFSFFERSCTLKYIKDPLVFCRLFNDSFLDGNPARRVNLDLDGYRMLADRFLGVKPELRKECFRILWDNCYLTFLRPYYRVIKAKCISPPNDWERLRRNFVDLWGPHWEIRLADHIVLPRFLMRFFYRVSYRIVRGRWPPTAACRP
jgi:abequosyltransferase